MIFAAFLVGCGGTKTPPPPEDHDLGIHDLGMAAAPDLLPPPDLSPPPPRPNVLTQHNDNRRSGAILTEKVLTPARVEQGFGKLFQLDVDDEVYAQPLYVPDVHVAGQGVHDVLYVATVNNSVYAFDANDGTQLWKVSVGGGGVPVTAKDVGQACGTYRDFSGHIGVVGTPVIDPVAGTLWLVARTKEPGFVQRLHAVDITSGSERTGSPVTITATSAGTAGKNGIITFNPAIQNQRAALLLSGGTVVITWSSHCDTGAYHGWALAYDAKSLAQVGVFNSTPNGGNGGIWQGGGGPVAAEDGSIYVAVGNGDQDGVDNFAQSLIKLMPRTLALADWFTPFAFDNMNAGDLDFGSSGTIMLPGTDILVAGTKTGELFVTHAASMGKIVDGDTQIIQKILVNGVVTQDQTNHLHGGPVFWDGPQGKWLYVWGENDFLKAYAFDGKRLSDNPVSSSTIKPALGMPGGMLAISANGHKDGIVWTTHPTDGDANQAVRHGILRAFDATDLTNEIWNSSMAAGDDLGQFAKFVAPTIVDGKVYMATFSNRIMVYGPK